MEEIENLKMECVFIKVELMIYHQIIKRIWLDQWEVYKRHVIKKIIKDFASFRHDEDMCKAHPKLYQSTFMHFIPLSFDSNNFPTLSKTHSITTFGSQ
jgi:hypothetical protein